MKILTIVEAQAQGLKHYFTGKACINGHLAPRTLRGMCTECTKERNIRHRGQGNNPSKYKWDGVDRVVRRLYWQTINSARKRGIRFDLTQGDLLDLWERASGRCEFSGILFRHDRSDVRLRPFYPSLDRIESSQGYTRDNCRFVCVAVNLALRDFGDAVLDEVCKSRVRMVSAPGLEPGTC